MEAMNDLFNQDGSIKEEELCEFCCDYGVIVIEANDQLIRYGANENLIAIRCHCEAGKLDDAYDAIQLK